MIARLLSVILVSIITYLRVKETKTEGLEHGNQEKAADNNYSLLGCCNYHRIA